jgi:hypothetical protein
MGQAWRKVLVQPGIKQRSVTKFARRLALPRLGRRRLEEDRRAGQLVGDVVGG